MEGQSPLEGQELPRHNGIPTSHEQEPPSILLHRQRQRLEAELERINQLRNRSLPREDASERMFEFETLQIRRRLWYLDASDADRIQALQGVLESVDVEQLPTEKITTQQVGK
jgi:hypothetical protein